MPSAIVGGVIAGVGSIAGGAIGAKGAKDAASKSAQASLQAQREAQAYQEKQAEIGRGDIAAAIEQARGDITGGTQQSNEYLLNARDDAIAAIQSGADQQYRLYGDANQQYNDTINDAYMDAMNVRTGVNKNAKNDLTYGYEEATRRAQEALAQSLGQLQGGYRNAQGEANRALSGARDVLGRYIDQGGQAFDLQAALSGALGRDAQQQAYDNYLASPGQQWLRDQQEKSLMRNASAMGGLRGANVMTALQEQAAGRAAQDFDNAYNRLSGLSSAGYGASSQMAGLEGSFGQLLANLAGSIGQQGAGLSANLGQYMAGLADNYGANMANTRIGYGNDMMALLTGRGDRIANADMLTAQAKAGVTADTSTNRANANANYWTSMANNNNSQSAALAELAKVLGITNANIAVGSGTNIGSQIMNAGTNAANAYQYGGTAASNAWANAFGDAGTVLGDAWDQYMAQKAATNQPTTATQTTVAPQPTGTTIPLPTP